MVMRLADCLVGFILPCDENGIPDSFESIQSLFHNGELAKYAFVY